MQWLPSRSVWVWMLLLWALGCGQTKQDRTVLPDAQVSGSRLQAFAWISEQGPTVYPKALYDSERGEFCSFRRARDGSFRCFPTAVVQQVSSSRCPPAGVASSREVVEVGQRSPLRYVEAGQSSACFAATSEIYEIGPEFTPSPECGSDALRDRVVYGRGPRVPDDAFVRAELVTSSSAADLLVGQYLVARDGTSQWFGFFSLAHGESCRPWLRAGGSHHCVVESILSSQSWSLTQDVDWEVCRRLIAEGNACGPSVFVQVAAEFHRVVPVARVAGTSFDTPAFRECLVAARGFMQNPQAIVEVVEADEFPSMVETEIARGLLTGTVLGSEDGRRLAPVDGSRSLTNGDYYCDLAVAGDGKVRCLPWAGISLFADSDCAEPLMVVGDTAPRYAKLEREERTLVYDAGEPFSGDVYTAIPVGSGIVCTQDLETFPAAAVRRAVEVPPDQFVEYSQVTLRP